MAELQAVLGEQTSALEEEQRQNRDLNRRFTLQKQLIMDLETELEQTKALLLDAKEKLAASMVRATAAEQDVALLRQTATVLGNKGTHEDVGPSFGLIIFGLKKMSTAVRGLKDSSDTLKAETQQHLTQLANIISSTIPAFKELAERVDDEHEELLEKRDLAAELTRVEQVMEQRRQDFMHLIAEGKSGSDAAQMKLFEDLSSLVPTVVKNQRKLAFDTRYITKLLGQVSEDRMKDYSHAEQQMFLKTQSVAANFKRLLVKVQMQESVKKREGATAMALRISLDRLEKIRQEVMAQRILNLETIIAAKSSNQLIKEGDTESSEPGWDWKKSLPISDKACQTDPVKKSSPRTTTSAADPGRYADVSQAHTNRTSGGTFMTESEGTQLPDVAGLHPARGDQNYQSHRILMDTISEMINRAKIVLGVAESSPELAATKAMELAKFIADGMNEEDNYHPLHTLLHTSDEVGNPQERWRESIDPTGLPTRWDDQHEEVLPTFNILDIAGSIRKWAQSVRSLDKLQAAVDKLKADKQAAAHRKQKSELRRGSGTDASKVAALDTAEEVQAEMEVDAKLQNASQMASAIPSLTVSMAARLEKMLQCVQEAGVTKITWAIRNGVNEVSIKSPQGGGSAEQPGGGPLDDDADRPEPCPRCSFVPIRVNTTCSAGATDRMLDMVDRCAASTSTDPSLCSRDVGCNTDSPPMDIIFSDLPFMTDEGQEDISRPASRLTQSPGLSTLMSRPVTNESTFLHSLPPTTPPTWRTLTPPMRTFPGDPRMYGFGDGVVNSPHPSTPHRLVRERLNSDLKKRAVERPPSRTVSPPYPSDTAPAVFGSFHGGKGSVAVQRTKLASRHAAARPAALDEVGAKLGIAIKTGPLRAEGCGADEGCLPRVADRLGSRAAGQAVAEDARLKGGESSPVSSSPATPSLPPCSPPPSDLSTAV
uniref:Uncharacterized protein n=1 Tax=Eutreptiella gymnastica TaxID=73025 RepID=A0A7S1N9Y7_9EUGL